VRRRAAVGIDDDLPAGDTGVTVRATDDEPSGWIDEKSRLAVAQVLGNDALDDVLGVVFAKPSP
jgi:hypothetical protein